MCSLWNPVPLRSIQKGSFTGRFDRRPRKGKGWPRVAFLTEKEVGTK